MWWRCGGDVVVLRERANFPVQWLGPQGGVGAEDVARLLSLILVDSAIGDDMMGTSSRGLWRARMQFKAVYSACWNIGSRRGHICRG